MRKKFCDVCGAEMPLDGMVAAMIHNEAAIIQWGTWLFQSGIRVRLQVDCCQDCAFKVNAFISDLRVKRTKE